MIEYLFKNNSIDYTPPIPNHTKSTASEPNGVIPGKLFQITSLLFPSHPLPFASPVRLYSDIISLPHRPLLRASHLLINYFMYARLIFTLINTGSVTHAINPLLLQSAYTSPDWL